MIAKTARFLYTISALVLGMGLVVILSLAGNHSRGPLENLFNHAGTAVHKVENTVIMQQRKHIRADDLDWFKPYATDMDSLRHPNTILLGAYDNQTTESFQSIISIEDTLHQHFPLVHIYTAWGDKPEEQFPKLQVEAILEMGSIPVITWEPWLTDFDGDKHTFLRPVEDRDKGGLAQVAKGVYDFYIKEWANAALSVGKPVFVRVGHEMNDPYRYPWGPQNNSAKDFIAAWRHIHNVFKEAGANNVIWVWSPHPAYGFFDVFYPGPDYVDYIGIGALNYGTVASWSKWWTFQEIFGNHYKDIAAFKKPIMITEFGCLAVGGSRSQWFSDAMESIPVSYPAVKAVLFFHYSSDRTTTQQAINWYFKDDTATTNAIIKQLKLWPANVKPRS